MLDSKEEIIEKKIVSFTVRFDSEVFDRLETHITSIPRTLRPSKYKFIQAAVERAISPDLSAIRPLKERLTISAENHATISVEDSEAEWVKKLLTILRCGDAEVVQAISSNLAVFARMAAQVAGHERGGTEVPGPDSSSLDQRIEEAHEAESRIIKEVEGDRSANRGGKRGDSRKRG